ncbi:FAD-dependent oxidoreductase [Pseudemcibacter aquimaris]|uniref:FAD-dependent oxidoreductase n=1 Tax=Pseudemcibacter aquimaris TaxID=2857064 RepID=UPI002012AD4C|nr:FAD-dependent oxidoreductase [Pseudemcibacter aquimaris]MCC3860325.1 NAD(P)/FAD-dependent oxidoreductase [Pseudemcibacter aquimaris]WDU57651.1 NAD(P)/FAD-dependent oxidoreductase [Pseudemcibacter aquimaris]
MTKDNITRRDFLNGTQIAITTAATASLLTPWVEAFGAPNEFTLEKGYYPPAKSGMRGSHDGSWETMHTRVLGEEWNVEKHDEEYDLVVVGGGISGLSSAYFYKQRKPDAKILILDNHDDFGGHAKRNEFEINGETRLGYGGTEAIETPSSFSKEAMDLLVDLGIDLDYFYEAFDQELYSRRGMGFSIVFDEKQFGETKHVVGYGEKSWEDFAKEAPLSDKAREDFIRVQTAEVDYLEGTPTEEKFKILGKTGYSAFLRDYVKVDEQVINIYQNWGMSFWCVDMEEVPTTAVQYYDGGIPGVDHTLPIRTGRGVDPYIFHFPDGNASIARLLVRKMIPEAMPGSTMEDIVTAKADYTKLDQKDQNINIRLNSTVVHVKNTDDGKNVDITYVRDDEARKVRAKKTVMACYNSAIPYLCPEMSDEQKAGLAFNVKVPLVYTKVLLRNWEAFDKLKTSFVYYTGGFYKQAELAYPVSVGEYKRSQTPDEPMVVHMCHVPLFRDIKGTDQWREGRRQILTTTFEEFEQHAKDQLTQALGEAGFDADRDIAGITVNRWPHGYSTSNALLWGKDYAEEDKPWVIGRKPFGNIHIANSDAGAKADTQTAIKEAYRAVAKEILG